MKKNLVESLMANLEEKRGQFDCEGDHYVKSLKNSALVLRALKEAALEMRYIPLALFLAAACETQDK